MQIDVIEKQMIQLNVEEDDGGSFHINLSSEEAKRLLEKLQAALYPDCEVTYATKTESPYGVTMGEYKVLGNTTYGSKDYVGGLRWNEYSSDGKHITCQCKGTLRFEGDGHPAIDDSHAEKVAKEAYDQIKTIL